MADLIRVYQAPAHALPMIADRSVQAIMLSSPYYGLRAYAGEQDIAWPAIEYAPMTGLHRLKVAGCDPACAHEWSSEAAGGLLHENRNFKRGTQEAVAGSGPLVAVREQRAGTGRYCVRCGGWKGPLGQEPTPAEFVAHIVLCAREWKRVLRPDGVLFFNIGDSYANDSKWGGATGGKHAQGLHGEAVGRGKRSTGLKAKDLIGIPWRVAFALQADGWTLRSSVAWTKRNPMPEPVKDRPARSHEDIFIFSQAERYYWDAEAVREENSSDTQRDHNLRYAKTYAKYDDRAAATGQPGNVNNAGIHARPGPPGRALRDVWETSAEPFRGSHYAVWPTKLVETMILASTSERGACPTCGAPWRRVIERGRPVPRVDNPNAALPYDAESGHNHGQGLTTLHLERSTSTLGWLPGCACYGIPPMPDLPDEPETPEGVEAGAPVVCPACEGRGEIPGPPLFPDDATVCARCKGKGGRPASAAWLAWRAEMDAWQSEYERVMADLIRPLLASVDASMATVPCVILDPFAGSGTTGAVAAAKGRGAILTDLSGVYLEGLVRARTTVQIELPRL